VVSHPARTNDPAKAVSMKARKNMAVPCFLYLALICPKRKHNKKGMTNDLFGPCRKTKK
jgi:hypothetical protein